MMNINAKHGARVQYMNVDAGYPIHQKKAIKHLQFGKVYTVDRTDVGNWHTNVYLMEVPNEPFNVVHFEDACADNVLPEDVLDEDGNKE